ncbi:hypothetical protein EDB86DRAFT_2969879 [Lactarius hatsudake]|nr:hypothetical protein EDB86DRAFT_2969879 [Lactarius hatsudake]
MLIASILRTVPASRDTFGQTHPVNPIIFFFCVLGLASAALAAPLMPTPAPNIGQARADGIPVSCQSLTDVHHFTHCA